jgi:hypothetical protein
MNYDQARQRINPDEEKISLWDWTTANNGIIYPARPCEKGICRHVTREEAERHFYEYCLGEVQEHVSNDEQRQCAICGTWTNKVLGNEQFWLLSLRAWLCDEHRNKQELGKLFPFEVGVELIHS